MPATLNRKIAVAPMMQHTDRHCRYLLRLISRHTLLYTEMVTSGALLHGDRARFLNFDAAEHPLALQLGGSEPQELAECAAIAEDWGYDEVNLNIGCPSDRVQSGRFGACLMAEPQRVADCVAAMRARTRLPVTVKTRIGIDDRDRYQDLLDFIEPVRAAGCSVFIVHARKAWLQGLSPKENRSKPPLHYDRVHQLKREFPDLTIVINGGIETLAAAQAQLEHVDGVMIGRAAYNNPYILAAADRLIDDDAAAEPNRRTIVEQFRDYADRHLAQGVRLHQMTRHLMGLFQGQPGARAFRRVLSEQGQRPGAGIEVIETAIRQVDGARS
ncbi:tRNA-dihydrouridine synthase A [Methylohalomonas lacus]|uniref:tRNA-dihydrouridine(20/20a) synthase n=1 Tax=Methylohalomonas lacus TaxID=398773 RepID=A0AAE3L3Q1_9GAMM|nr:tRNA dihydrouridine(20/20a) synthase DusA [Methylohalomonas lacus]MCS3902513.1 tRNA-dihydrouridine synthase A [Methylohalomonas lacus]